MVTILSYQSRKSREPRIGGHYFYVRLAASVILTISLIVIYRCEVALYPRVNPEAFFLPEDIATFSAWVFAALVFLDTPTRPRRIVAWAWLTVCLLITFGTKLQTRYTT